MAWIRFRHWNVDGVPAHKAVSGSREYVFLDTDQGLCDVRDRAGVEFLLSRPANYEIASECYGFSFGADGQQIDNAPSVSPVATPEEDEEGVEPKPAVKKRGRQKKVRR